MPAILSLNDSGDAIDFPFMEATIYHILISSYGSLYSVLRICNGSRTPVTRYSCSKRTGRRRKSGPEKSSPSNDLLRSGAGRARKTLRRTLEQEPEHFSVLYVCLLVVEKGLFWLDHVFAF